MDLSTINEPIIEKQQFISKRKKTWNLIIYVFMGYLILRILYELAKWETFAFLIGAIIGFIVSLWVYVIIKRNDIQNMEEMGETQSVILEQNMVIILALEKIGAIEKDDSENLR